MSVLPVRVDAGVRTAPVMPQGVRYCRTGGRPSSYVRTAFEWGEGFLIDNGMSRHCFGRFAAVASSQIRRKLAPRPIVEPLWVCFPDYKEQTP
jgi:ribosomal protein S14